MTLSLGFSPCPNDTFVFHALVHGLVPGAPEVDVTYADIDVLNQLAQRRELDIVKVSYGALGPLLDDHELLDAGSALGLGCGPLVVTLPGRSSLEGATVGVPGLDTTAYLLMRLWPGSASIKGIEVMPFDQIMPAVAEGRLDAGLVIHESRFTYPSFGLDALADLGDWWESDTGMPVPLGAIIARKGLDTAAISAAVRTSVEMAWADPTASRDYVLSHSQELAPDVVDAHIALYVNEYTRSLGEQGHAAIAALLARSAR